MGHLVAVTGKRLAKKDSELRIKIDLQKRETDLVQLKKLDSEIIALNWDIATIKELRDQIAAMWEDGSYREAGNEPYKLASRVALTCLVFSSQHHLETLTPLVDSFPHSDMNSSGVL